MIPDSLVGLVLFAASLGPGYVYLRVAELRQPRQERSQLVEAAELAFIGAIASSLAALLVAFTAEATGFSDAVDHPLRLPTLLAGGFVLAYGGAAIAAIIAHRGVSASIKPGYSAWHFLLADDIGVDRKYATVELRDGRSVAGWVAAYTVEPADANRRELILSTPLRLKRKDGASFEFMLDDGIILQGADIVAISVQTHADRGPKPANFLSRWFRRNWPL